MAQHNTSYLQSKKIQLDAMGTGEQKASGLELLELCSFDIQSIMKELKSVEERTDEIISSILALEGVKSRSV